MEILIFILGLIFGSFANVLIWRLNDEKAPKFWQGRSVCPNCKKQIGWLDNVPVISIILLRGKCRHCHKKISVMYPIIEMCTALMFLGVWFLFERNVVSATNFRLEIVDMRLLLNFSIIQLISVFAVAYSFLIIFFSDLKYGLIPDEMVLLGVVGAFIYNLQSTIYNNFWVGLFSMLAFFAVVVATKFRGMGLGDVKLAFLMGFLLGFPNALVAFWVSFVSGGIFAVVLLLLKKTKFSATIPLGPFLVFGTLISALWSKQLLGFVGF